jgi:aminotransferase
MDDQYYRDLATEYAHRRDMMMEILDAVGIAYYKPEGAYYMFCDISDRGFESDLAFTKYLVKDIGVAVVPGGSFFGDDNKLKHHYVRFCFSRREETLKAARAKLLKLKKA